jgi:hypothetical protein
MKPLVPAKAGTQGYNSVYVALDSRLRGNERKPNNAALLTRLDI